MELTGELADGWLGTSFIPEAAEVFLGPMKKGLEKSGRTMADIDIQIGGSFEIGDDVERMVEARKPGMAFTLGLGAMGSPTTNFYNDAFKRSGYEDAAVEVQKLWVEGKRDEAARRVPDEMILKTNFIGSREMILDRVRVYREAGVTTMRISTGGRGNNERLDKLAEVMDMLG